MTSRVLPMLLSALLPLSAAAQAEGAATAPAASAETPGPIAPPPEVPAGIHRVLAGHRFEPSTLVDDPFSTSAVATRFGYIYSKVGGPFIGRDPLRIDCCRDAQVGGFGGAFAFAVRAADWLAIRVAIDTVVYTGLNRESIIIVGPGIQTAADVLLVSGFTLGDRFRVAGLLGLSSKPALNILLLSGLIDAIQAGNVDTKTIFDASNTLQYDVGASAAWAIVNSLGLVAEVQFIAPNKVGTVSSFAANGILGATSLDFNFRELWASVPIGLSAAYRITAPINTATFQTVQDFLFAIGYTGRPGLSARMEVGFRRLNLRPNQLLTTAALLDWVVRYDW